MATSELGSGKTVIILAVVVGCFGVLWPRVFYPMMQTTFMASKSRGLTDGLGENAVCCGVIYENTLDLKLFAELCQSVINPGQASRSKENPPEGTLERCRLKILELCDLDINELLDKKEEKIRMYRIEVKKAPPAATDKPKLNLTQCLETHFNFGAQNSRKLPKETTLPSYMRQERSPRAPISGHPALHERGPQYQSQKKVQNYPSQGSRTVSGIRPNIGGKTELSSKGGNGGGAMGFLMPIYTVGIVVFFMYTMAKVVMKKSQNESDSRAKTNNYHVDPEYRKYLLSEQYRKGNMAISYQEYLNLKKHSEFMNEPEEENECLATKLLSNGGRKQVARMDIDTRLDILRRRLEETEEAMSIIMRQMAAFHCNHNHANNHQRWKENDAGDDMLTAADELINEDAKFLSNVVEGPLTELSEHLKHLIHQQDSAKIAVMELQNQENKSAPPQPSDLQPQEGEVSNILLEKAVPSDAQLLVTESQCLTHTSVEHIDGWSECEDNPIIVTGKMTISLLGNEQAVVNSTESEQMTQADEDAITPTPDLDEEEEDENQNDGGGEDEAQDEEDAQVEVEQVQQNGIENHVEEHKVVENNEPIESVDHIEQDDEQTNLVGVIREVNGNAHVSL